jgi:hypothetical protein
LIVQGGFVFVILCFNQINLMLFTHSLSPRSPNIQQGNCTLFVKYDAQMTYLNSQNEHKQRGRTANCNFVQFIWLSPFFSCKSSCVEDTVRITRWMRCQYWLISRQEDRCAMNKIIKEEWKLSAMGTKAHMAVISP